ncbi:MAG: TatD family hydrolase [Spirochaetaceae bacterium]
MNDYIDSHNHITETTPILSLYNSYQVSDILLLSNIKKMYKSIGLHPLFLETDINWNNIIDNIKNDRDIKIGEIGLDKRNNNMIKQVDVFNTFLNLSKEYSRSISIHCVKAWGPLLNCLQSNFNKDIPAMFHGYSGSYETFRQLLELNSFFSFSNREIKNERLNHIIKSVPIDKLLIESDMLSKDFISLGSKNYTDQIITTYKSISSIKNIPLDVLKENIYNNFDRFLKEN